MQVLKRNLREAAIGAVMAAVLVASPVALIRGGFHNFVETWQEIGLYAVIVIGSGASGFLGFRLSPGKHEWKRQRWMVWGGAAFLFLYVACAALCEKIGTGIWNSAVFRSEGFILVVAGMALRLWSIRLIGPRHSAFVALQPDHELICRGPYKVIRHPSYLGILLILAGIAMIFAAWLPLLALPGLFVALNWRIVDEERFLSEHFGDEYDAYRKKTWRLFPRIY